MKIAVTGASGHIGSNLCRRLLELGHHIRVLVYRDKRGFEGLPVEQFHGSLEDVSSLEALISGVDIVFHLAAQISIEGKNDRNLLKENALGTANVVRVIRGLSRKIRLIHFSSIHALVHDPMDQSMDESRPLALHDPIYYTQSKAHCERIVLDAAETGLDVVILNPTAVIGPNDFKPSLLGQALIRFYQGKIPAMIPGGYDWVDVRDIVEAAVAAMEKGKPGKRYILSGNWASIRDLGLMIHKYGGRPIPRFQSPFWLARIGVPIFRLLAMASRRTPLYTHESLHIIKTGNPVISHELAGKELDYHPRALELSINDTLSWYRNANFL